MTSKITKRSTVRILDGPNFPKWDEFVFSHEHGTIYHTTSWMKVIKGSYGHTPVYIYTEDNNAKIMSVLPAFLVKGRITGSRLVSVPGAQSCNPLVYSNEDLHALLSFLRKMIEEGQADYLELRTDGTVRMPESFDPDTVDGYSTYALDIARPSEDVVKTFHKGQTQRSIRKALKSDLKIVKGTGTKDLKDFYRLYLGMRKDYGLLPQPYRFFLCLWEELFPKGEIDILSAEKNGIIVSSVLLLKFKDTVTYEYGASLPSAHKDRASHLLLWKAIEDGCAHGYHVFDFGRTSDDNASLSNFKSNWGTTKIALPYLYIPTVKSFGSFRQNSLPKQVMGLSLKYLPTPVCQIIGRILYRELL
jgi:hypothetical protein